MIRVDGDRAVASGRVMRMIALAQALERKGCRATFVATDLPASLRTRLETQHRLRTIEVTRPADTDIAATCRAADELGASIVVLDGDSFTDAMHVALRENGRRVVAVDDYAEVGPYASDFILNHHGFATEGMYRDRASYTKLLLGSSYALLRREFTWRSHRPADPTASVPRIFVSLGDADVGGAALVVTLALASLSVDVSADIVVGEANPNHSKFAQMVLAAGADIRLHTSVPDIARLMASANLAIVRAGNTCSELAYSRVPMLVVVHEKKQRVFEKFLENAGIGRSLGVARKLTENGVTRAVELALEDHLWRGNVAARGRALVDGRGADRVADALLAP